MLTIRKGYQERGARPAGASATEIQALLGHDSLNTSQGYIDATADATRRAARANRTDRAPQQLARGVAGGGAGSSRDEASSA